MSPQIPAAVRSADLARFAIRASQLEKVKPLISYYCNYWIVNQILAKKLEKTDQDCFIYTTHLMDKLEQFKADNQEDDAAVDDLARRAYVEEFALETFQRADNALRANKASRQTADTFQAAAAFLELLQIWGEIDAENAAKVKYAKYHALRIAKALKAGEDPNASNPATEYRTSGEDALPALDPNDPEVQMLNGSSTKPRQPSVVDVPDEAHKIQSDLARQSSLDESLHPSRDPSVPRPSVIVPRPKVEDATDDTDRIQSNLARQSSLDQSLHPSRAPSIPHPTQDEVSPVEASASAEDFYQQTSHDDVSPLGSEAERKSSIGGNYFPQTAPAQHQQLYYQEQGQPSFSLPSALSDPPPEPTLPPSDANTAFSPPAPSPLPQTQHPSFIPPSQPDLPPPFQPQPQSTHPPQQQQQQQQPYSQPQPHNSESNSSSHNIHHHLLLQLLNPTLTPPTYPLTAPTPFPPHPSSHPAQTNITVDDEAISSAQKHARWAISALNFEDVPTAIRELRGALEALGASGGR
ncbi:hypothetical protein GJ744_003890 [Endocarpon pusillum]|uniref:Vta1 C-terminal domain-containing protein n=1 Tax=Endocarpon pusillum TaxID=364733 RepID=A0A8H7AA41_9EURO|nr:hypothetical protein GJ744_003890 [Endocarpon pusillum]